MRFAPFLALLACTNPQQLELDDHRATWDAAAVQDYAYTLSHGCFCAPEETDPVRITVFGGVVDSAVYDETATSMVPGDPVYADYEVLTIDALFDRAADAVANADDVTLAYDEDFGFPTRISIDWMTNAIDDEEELNAGAFTPDVAPAD